MSEKLVIVVAFRILSCILLPKDLENKDLVE